MSCKGARVGVTRRPCADRNHRFALTPPPKLRGLFLTCSLERLLSVNLCAIHWTKIIDNLVFFGISLIIGTFDQLNGPTLPKKGLTSGGMSMPSGLMAGGPGGRSGFVAFLVVTEFMSQFVASHAL